jgi:hypothetical protein
VSEGWSMEVSLETWKHGRNKYKVDSSWGLFSKCGVQGYEMTAGWLAGCLLTMDGMIVWMTDDKGGER